MLDFRFQAANNDDRRVIVQIKTRMKVGELNMYLREYVDGAG